MRLAANKVEKGMQPIADRLLNNQPEEKENRIGGLRIFGATEEMADQLVSFHNSYFGDNRKSEHWIWEYRGCHPDLSFFTVVVDEGRLVGTMGSIPIYLRVAGEKILSNKLENALLVPEYRGKETATDARIFHECKAREKGSQCLWAYTPVSKSAIREGYTVFNGVICGVVAAMNLSVIASDTLKSTKHPFKKKILRLASQFLLWIYGSILRATVLLPKSNYDIVSEPLRETDLDDFYRRLRIAYPNMIHIDLNARYLKWRIHDNPILQYRSYYVYDGKDLKAYAFVHAGDVRAFLTDFNFEHIDAGRFLLSRIVNDLKDQKAGFIVFAGNLENPSLKRVFRLLRRWGFVHFNKTNLIVKNLQFRNGRALTNAENWCMTGIGTEGYTL
ncbi:GNAT family N-acetyltransferase [Desulfomonile tiedjei]|uniref:N-acetyltransferase domain-containing protein n=1 Tax=Desulfomonile tiedjei (strain ATCC 49306 / DSM 6799 / DCB-1) TaxID=706587 RepID=I4CBK5_DESTA|nr:GNAT family N-acetyltransferase [Desulfomonile tiedjei]AFM26946.1 hypothetical protein Desti_4312 [Desulfomonile tiedjei DSM 6799]